MRLTPRRPLTDLEVSNPAPRQLGILFRIMWIRSLTLAVLCWPAAAATDDLFETRIRPIFANHGDVFATVYKAIGIQWDTEYMTPVGRPIKIANSLNDTTGEPIKEFV